MRPKEVQRANRATSEAHRKTVDRPEALRKGSWRKQRPAAIGFAECMIRDGEPIAKTVDAGTLIRLNLEQLEYGHRFTRRSHELEFTNG